MPSGIYTRKEPHTNVGKKLTQQHKDNISKGNKGKHKISTENRLKMVIAQRAAHLKASKKTRLKMSKSQTKRWASDYNRLKNAQARGTKHPLWIRDRTTLKKFNNTTKDRRSSAYQEWRKRTWKRDNYTCKLKNNKCKGRIEAHHIRGYTKYPKLRYKLNNGITLCHAHHPRKKAEEKRLEPIFKELVSVSKAKICAELSQ